MTTNNINLEFDEDSIKLYKTNIDNSECNNNFKSQNNTQRFLILYLISIIIILLIVIFFLLKRLNEQNLKFLTINEISQKNDRNSVLKIINKNDDITFKNINNNTIINSSRKSYLNFTNNYGNMTQNIANIDYNNIQTKNIINKSLNINEQNKDSISINLNNYNISNSSQDNSIININTIKDFEFACINKSVKQIAELYYSVCSSGKLLDKIKYKLSSFPKISIIIPLYNREKYILRVLRSIQNQSMKDIEIIFVDDFSTDSTKNIIKSYQKEDERIILIEHSKNEGTLISRNDGVFKAKGEFIMFVDSDDLLLPNILVASYEKAEKYKYDIILFAIFKRTEKGRYFRYNKWRGIRPIYQPKLSSFIYYGKGYLKQIDFHLYGKLIKKKVFIKAINSISDYYLKNHICINEDGIMNFMLLKKANSLKYIHFYGYIYDTNLNSVISTLNHNINKTIRDYILYLRYMFEYTDDNSHEKQMAEEQLRFIFYKFKNQFNEVTENFQFMYDNLNLYLNSTLISKNSKKIIDIMINKLKIAENKSKNITKNNKTLSTN